MPTAIPAASAVETLSAGEERFEWWRKRIGAFAAPIVFVGMLLIPMPGLTVQAHRLAAIMATVVVLWISEALPMPVTALLGAAACVAMGVAKADVVFAPFANQLIFLFIGGFILARAIFTHGLDRRLALAVLSLRGIGSRPARIMVAFGAVTAFISGWVSNTATTAMMFAIGLSILRVMMERDARGEFTFNRRYATGLMLMTTFAASIGGLATPIGTAPNIIGLGYIRDALGVQIPFFKWSLIGVPVVLALYAWLAFYLTALSPAGIKILPGSHEMLEAERNRLGRWSTPQYSTAIAFGITVGLWVTPGLAALVLGETSKTYRWMSDVMPEGVAAIIGAVLLFLFPGDRDGRAINWSEAVKIDWGVVLLYGGGLALGTLMFNTGLAKAIGESLTQLLPVQGSPLAMLIAATAVAAILSETTSNTASATMIVPVVIALAQSAGVDPLEPALGATMGASLGFMLPVSTPCNAIVYGSGYIPITRMIRYGILLDIVGVVIIVAMVKLLVPLIR